MVQLLSQVESGVVDVGRFPFGNAIVPSFKRPDSAVQRRRGKAGKSNEPVGDAVSGMECVLMAGNSPSHRGDEGRWSRVC